MLLVSTYELGHQPLHAASPAGALRAAGHDVRCVDTSVEPWSSAPIDWAEAVAFSVPMHTAMRLGLKAAESLRARRPELPVCFYGLYAPVSKDLTLGYLADRIIAGEYEAGLSDWLDELAGVSRGASAEPPPIRLGHDAFVTPARDLLPPLDRYARLAVDGERRLAGYVEASHGCAHECRHCPIPAIYGGRIRLVSSAVVLDDIAQLVDMGARHITFGDPDWLNGWKHSLQVVREMHRRWPAITFDCTTKVEHVLRHARLWPELAAAGCAFVVSAVECVNDDILAKLDKGHTAAQASEAIGVLREAGVEMRPSFMPFTPWTTPQDVLDILHFVVAHDLLANVDPVQYTIRLLVPEGSLMLQLEELQTHLAGYDAERLTYTWHSADPSSDELQVRLAALVENGIEADEPAGAAFLKIHALVAEAAGTEGAIRRELVAAGSVEGRPRLTEPWFC